MNYKCKLKECLSNEKIKMTYYCSITLPNAVNLLNPDSEACHFYSKSKKDDLNWLRENGGMTKIILHNKGKKTTEEIKKLKPRKSRSDKGKKRKSNEVN